MEVISHLGTGSIILAHLHGTMEFLGDSRAPGALLPREVINHTVITIENP